MTLSEKVAQLLELQSDEHIREEVLKILDTAKSLEKRHFELGSGGPPIDFEDTAYIVAAFVRELTRTAPADAPRIIKRVLTENLVTRGGLG